MTPEFERDRLVSAWIHVEDEQKRPQNRALGNSREDWYTVSGGTLEGDMLGVCIQIICKPSQHLPTHTNSYQ